MTSIMTTLTGLALITGTLMAMFGGLEMFLLQLLLIVVAVYAIFTFLNLLTRLVNATERIADKLDQKGDSA